MGARTVRLDDEAEEALLEIRKGTGMSISEALKNGLLALRTKVGEQRKTTAWEIYEKIDLGSGGYAIAPSTDAKAGARKAIRRKHRR